MLPGSQPGSPQADAAAAASGSDLDTIVRRLQGLEAEANRAAQARSEAQAVIEQQQRELESLRAAGSTGRPLSFNSIVDTRLLAKPSVFHGSAKAWPDWSFTMRAYLGAIDNRFAEALKLAAEAANDTPMSVLSDEYRALSLQLFYTFTMLCADKALVMLRNVEEGNGLSAWRASPGVGTPSTGKVWSDALGHPPVQVRR